MLGRQFTLLPLIGGLLLLTLVADVRPAGAQSSYYIRAGATGAQNGSDWTNAFASIPATLERGATYYVADGSYGGYTFDDPESATSWIYLKKATAADHGTSTGWQAAYGDGVAIFSSWTFNTGYWHMDGQVGGGPGSWEAGHGFRIVTSGSTKAIRLNASRAHNFIFKHIEATSSTLGTFTGIVYSFGGFDGVGNNNVSFSHCWFHTLYGPVFHLGYSSGWTVEYSKLGDNNPPGSGGSDHSEIFSLLGNDRLTIRYNWMYRWRSTGGIIAINGTEGGFGANNIAEDVHIYGNVFDQDGSNAHWIIAAINDASNQQFARRWKVYNNTFVSIASSSTTVYLFSVAVYEESANEFKNNVIYGNTDNMSLSSSASVTHNSYQGSGASFSGTGNQLIASDPFINFSGKDYRLSPSHTLAPGVSLPAPFNTDMFGNVRGSDGTWDRGAFEGSGGTLTIPTSPTNLRIVR